MNPSTTIPLIESLHLKMVELVGERPMPGAECALVAACILAAMGRTHTEMIPEAARLAWRGCRNTSKPKGLPYTNGLVTIALDPDEERLKVCEALFLLVHRSGVDPVTSAALLMQLAAGWAGMSMAMNEKRFVQTARWAYERAGRWFELAEPEAP